VKKEISHANADYHNISSPDSQPDDAVVAVIMLCCCDLYCKMRFPLWRYKMFCYCVQGDHEQIVIVLLIRFATVHGVAAEGRLKVGRPLVPDIGGLRVS